jgi:two-component system CheB/CheR fusion protein
LRELPECAHTVLVAITGYGQDDDRRRSREAGIDHHLVKPVAPETLQKLLGSLERR